MKKVFITLGPGCVSSATGKSETCTIGITFPVPNFVIKLYFFYFLMNFLPQNSCYFKREKKAKILTFLSIVFQKVMKIPFRNVLIIIINNCFSLLRLLTRATSHMFKPK